MAARPAGPSAPAREAAEAAEAGALPAPPAWAARAGRAAQVDRAARVGRTAARTRIKTADEPPPARDAIYIANFARQNPAPCGSVSQAKRPTPGTSNGSAITLPPIDFARAALASTSSVPK